MYGAEIWDPLTAKDKKSLESVQYFAVKICCKTWNSSYEDLLKCSGFFVTVSGKMTPEIRQKIVNKFVFFPSDLTIHQSILAISLHQLIVPFAIITLSFLIVFVVELITFRYFKFYIVSII